MSPTCYVVIVVLLAVVLTLVTRHASAMKIRLASALKDRRRYMLIDGMNYAASMINDFRVTYDRLPKNLEEFYAHVRRGSLRLIDPDTGHAIGVHLVTDAEPHVNGLLNYVYYQGTSPLDERVILMYVDPSTGVSHDRVIYATGIKYYQK